MNTRDKKWKTEEAKKMQNFNCQSMRQNSRTRCLNIYAVRERETNTKESKKRNKTIENERERFTLKTTNLCQTKWSV